jgi:glycine cleavage system H lipoate-binding protein
MVAILVLLTIIGFLTVDFLVERRNLRHAALAPAGARWPPSVRVPVDVAALPAGLFVGPGHAWMELRPSGAVRLGADRVPLTLLGGVDSIETAPAGSVLHRGDTAAVLRMGNREVKLRTPVDGVVTAVNTDLAGRPEALAERPFGGGWLVSLAPRDLGGAIRRMFVADGAAAWMRRELARLRDLLVGMGDGALAGATLPDGGLPVAGLAAKLTDDGWRTLTEALFDPGAEPGAAPAAAPAEAA